jgi:ATP-binding cassette subfamily B protein/ATP-binding cassette subfamily C protein
MDSVETPMPSDKILNQTVSACRSAMMGIAIVSLFINLLMLTAPIYMMQVFDRVLSSRSTETLLLMSLIAMIALLTLGALELVRSMAFVRVGAWIDQRLGGVVFSNSVSSALRLNREPSTQGLRDVSTIRSFLTGSAIFSILDAPWTPIFLAVVYLLHPWLGLMALIGAVMLFALALINDLASRNLLRKADGASIKALRRAETAVRNANVIEAMGMLPNIIHQWRAESDEALGLQTQASNRSGAITAISKFVRMALQVGILGLGAYLVIHDALGPGSMIAASILMGRALAPVEMAIGGWRSAVAARDAYRRVSQLITTSPSNDAGMTLPRPTGRVSVEDVFFVYPGAEEPTVRKVSFTLLPGEALGLIGPTASGKSTLASLLVGNFIPRAGHVRLDGMEVTKWDSVDRGQHMGYLPQGIELFGGLVHENISRMAEASPEDVIAAATLAGVHDMILHLPSGYDTEIGENGVALSGGQRQRIGLARAVFGNPSFVVLDEPNANLDNDGETALLETIVALKKKGTTVIVIAHRPSLLRDMDKVLILNKGAMRAFGPPAEVIPAVTRSTSVQDRERS